mgnify:CR=1 FL=1
MKGIDKRKHEHIIACMEELLTLNDDENKIIEEEIETLSQSYDSYNILIRKIHNESDRYHTLYSDIQRRIYKKLRKVRCERKDTQ